MCWQPEQWIKINQGNTKNVFLLLVCLVVYHKKRLTFKKFYRFGPEVKNDVTVPVLIAEFNGQLHNPNFKCHVIHVWRVQLICWKRGVKRVIRTLHLYISKTVFARILKKHLSYTNQNQKNVSNWLLLIYKNKAVIGVKKVQPGNTN